MAIQYKQDGTDLAVNITVGNGIGCKVTSELYDAAGNRIAGPLPNGFFLDGLVRDNPAPEYKIPAPLLAQHDNLTILHTYRPLNWAGGVFEAISRFDQNGNDRGGQLKRGAPDIGGRLHDEIALEVG